ncbi:MAG: hypothetical protein E4H00_03235 [Myxococcales bacterium]|nr:MAG: hypothetical protein E4H00_03235 [Myxococcales bacterium]
MENVSQAHGRFARVVAEVRDDPALRAYGAVLALIHVLTAWWLFDNRLYLLLPTTDPVCWPLVPGCDALRVLSPRMLRVVVVGYGSLGALATVLFLCRRTAGVAFVLLAGLVALEISILALDFRLRRNQHYMALATMLTFLALPNRRDTVRVLIVLFYVWAGMLKLDYEWLSGAGLYKPIWLFTGRGIVVACIYVVVLELVIVWGLLTHRRGWFWAAFAQVLVFHVFSWNVVGYFYPVLMFGLLTIFPLCQWVPPPAGSTASPTLLRDLVRGRAAVSVYVAATALSVLQLIPHLYPGDIALTGEGRLYALNMFDAKMRCDAFAELRNRDGSTSRESLLLSTEPRTRCDPIMVRAAALMLCARRDRGELDFVDLDMVLSTRRFTDPVMHTLIDLHDVCANPPRYDPFFHNDWIMAVSRASH